MVFFHLQNTLICKKAAPWVQSEAVTTFLHIFSIQVRQIYLQYLQHFTCLKRDHEISNLAEWSIGALHINTYSKTQLPWCPCNSLRSHSRSCPISWPPRWTQPLPPLMPTSYWTTSSSPSGRTWGTGLTCNFDQLHFFFFTNFDLRSDTSEVALEDNKISGKLFFVGNPLNEIPS